MAMSKPTLTAELSALLVSKFGWPVFEQAEVDKMAGAIAEAVIDHIVANATLVGASITDPTVVVVPATGIGAVTNPIVDGGIE